MHRQIGIIALLLLAIAGAASAQSGYTSVTATVADTNGSLYVNAPFNVSFYDPGTSGNLPLLNGSTFQKAFTGVNTSSSGLLAISLPDNGIICSTSNECNTQWIFSFTSQQINGNKYTFSCQMAITGASQNISAALTACAAILPTNGGGNIPEYIVPCNGADYSAIQTALNLEAANLTNSGGGSGMVVTVGQCVSNTAITLPTAAGSPNGTVILQIQGSLKVPQVLNPGGANAIQCVNGNVLGAYLSGSFFLGAGLQQTASSTLPFIDFNGTGPFSINGCSTAGNGSGDVISIHDNVGLSSQSGFFTFTNGAISNFSSGHAVRTYSSNPATLPAGYKYQFINSSINEGNGDSLCMTFTNTSYVTVTNTSINCKDPINLVNAYTNGSSMGGFVFDGISISEALNGKNFVQIKTQAGYPSGFGVRGITFHDMIVADVTGSVSLIGGDASAAYYNITGTDSWINKAVDCTGTSPSGLLLTGGYGSGDESAYPTGNCWGSDWTYQSVSGLYTFGGVLGTGHTSLGIVGNLGINTETGFGSNIATLAPIHIVGAGGRTSVTSGSIPSGLVALVENNAATNDLALLAANGSTECYDVARVSMAPNNPAGRLCYVNPVGWEFIVEGNIVATLNSQGLAEALTTPASSSAACATGTVVWDVGFIYICTATNTWKRVAIATF